MEYVVKGIDQSQIDEMEGARLKKIEDAGIDEDEILKKARDNISLYENAFGENFTTAKDDRIFATTDQWTSSERSEFARLFRPVMTFNKMADILNKTLGEFRKNKPDLLVRAMNKNTKQEQIDLRADLVRHFSYKSQNDLIYQHAFKCILTMGFAALQVDFDYDSPTSFTMSPFFPLIQEPMLTSFDPAAQMPHKGDGNFCSRAHIMTREEFSTKYPYMCDAVSYTDINLMSMPEYQGKDVVVVLDYYQKEWYSETLHKLSNGKVVTDSEWKEMQKDMQQYEAMAQSSEVLRTTILDLLPQIKATRQTENYKIMHYRLTQNAIVDFREWPSKHLPIVFVDGNSTYIDGKQKTKSFIRDGKDAQKFINYVGSEIAGEIKNRRREQWVATPANITGNDLVWRNPETQQGVLLATPDPVSGQMPQKVAPWDLSPVLLTQYQRGTADIKEILGFHEELQGNQTNAVSGIAIARRQLAASMSSYVYSDNMNQAIEQCGRIVLDLLNPLIGDEERTLMIRKTDGKTKSTTINKRMPDGTIENQLDDGEYDVEIDVGPSFAVQREAAMEIMMTLLQANPPVTLPLMGDLIVSNADLQFMPQLVERFKTLVPPQILAKENGDPPPPPGPPSPEQQAMQQQQQLAQQDLALKEQELHHKEQDLQIRQEKRQLEQEKAQLEKAKLQLEYQRLKSEIEQSDADRTLELHKAHLSYNSNLDKLLTGLHSNKGENKRA